MTGLPPEMECTLRTWDVFHEIRKYDRYVGREGSAEVGCLYVTLFCCYGLGSIFLRIKGQYRPMVGIRLQGYSCESLQDVSWVEVL
jgi:hypothetical protein